MVKTCRTVLVAGTSADEAGMREAAMIEAGGVM